MQRWDPTSGWVEWHQYHPDWLDGGWYPMTQETAVAVASWAEFIIEALPTAVPLCARCSAPMPEHILMETFGQRDGMLVCPR